MPPPDTGLEGTAAGTKGDLTGGCENWLGGENWLCWTTAGAAVPNVGLVWAAGDGVNPCGGPLITGVLNGDGRNPGAAGLCVVVVVVVVVVV